MPRVYVTAEDYERVMAETQVTGVSPAGVVHRGLVALEEQARYDDALDGLVAEIADDAPPLYGFDDRLRWIRSHMLALLHLARSNPPSPGPDPWEYDQAERQAIEHEPASSWTRVRHPEV